MYRLIKILACIEILALSSALLIHRNAATDDTMGLDVVGYNHTDHSIGSFSVNSEAGSFLAKHEQGGFACCVSVHAKYTPGMTVTVRWTDNYDKNPQSRTVTVPPFRPKDTGVFAVHFLRSGEIKVFVTDLVLTTNPEYPLKGDEAKM
ncbi:DUF3304 domain-containing protein [Paraburkholderia sp. CNPSo 3272]|uniref:DUF3304 domain-containing protein n=1 Tax=Paraburkholderia sp. CNPSo 3272 TaxID=2940931 RepID=UPI0020B7C521|nr:DUF3304 domain-containing protein [Paraburkholderia sp. CNPSo 3272]MCP3723236.1 DUF3304 domain-containing protein [Paraburkholderia sp. CNPSo 3272]